MGIITLDADAEGTVFFTLHSGDETITTFLDKRAAMEMVAKLAVLFELDMHDVVHAVREEAIEQNRAHLKLIPEGCKLCDVCEGAGSVPLIKGSRGCYTCNGTGFIKNT